MMKPPKFKLNMTYLRAIVTGMILVFIQNLIQGQPSYFVNITTVQVISPYSSNLSDYVNNPSKIVISVQVPAGVSEQKIKLMATLKGDNGIEIKSNLNALANLSEITLSEAANPSQLVNALYIRNLFDLESLDIQGTTMADLQNNGLPAGNYQLCIVAVNSQVDPQTGAAAGTPVSEEKCSNPFTIIAPFVNIYVENVQVISPYSSHLADYLNNPSKIIITLKSNFSPAQYKIKLLASIKGDNGIQIITNPANLNSLVEITLNKGQPTVVLNATVLSNLFNAEDVTMQGITYNELVNGSGLPAGNYQLCITPVASETDAAIGIQAGQILSDERCSNFFPIMQQTANVSVSNIQVVPPHFNHIADYLNNPSKIIITIQSNMSYDQYKIKLLASLKGDNGIQISTNPSYISQLDEITLLKTQPTVVLNATAISNLFNLEGITFQGITYNDLVNGSGLPEGNYQLCITPVASETDAANGIQIGQALSEERCSNIFPVNNLEPPVIINPMCGSDLTEKIPQNIIFNWSIPAGAKPGIQYDFKMVEIYDSLKNPNDAMQSATDPAFFEKTVTGNVLLYSPADPKLTPGNRYAFTVTAIDPSNNTVFRNGGKSEVCYFSYHPLIITPNSGNPQDTTKNDENKNPNPISVMDTPDLNCSCKSTLSDKTVNNANAASGKIVHVGAFDMSLGNDVVEKNGALTGTGTIPVPFLNSSLVKIRVEYSDLKVNSSNQAVEGTVRAKRNGNAVSVLPTADPPNVKPQPFKTADILKIGDYINNSANKAIASVNNSINSAGWEMPFGIQKEISGENITIAITDIIFTPTQAGFNACLAFDIPEGGGNNTLALGAKNICFKDSKNLCGDAVLFLVEDFKIDPLNLTFIKATGNNDSQAGTYAIFDPNGFKQLHVNAEYEFSQNVIVNQKDKGVVKATFETDIKSWNNWYATVNIDPFYVAGYEEWAFSLKTPAFYDHSDSLNAPDMPKAAIEGKTNHMDKSWMGFFFSELDASLPAVIKRADKKPITIAVKNFMIDKQGFTGDVNSKDILAIDDGDLDSWYYSLDNLNVRFVNSSFIKGGLDGKVLLPVSGKPAKDNQDELDYTSTLSKPASADSSMKFQFVIKPKDNIKAKLWEATLNLKNTSSIIVSNQKSKDNPKGDFRANAILNGDISIVADLSPIPKINIKAVEFQDLQLMTYSPYISGKLSFFGFASPDKSAGGFPIGISGIKPVLNGSTAGIGFDLKITLADIAALPNATFKLAVVGDLTMTNGRPDWGNPRLQVDSISVKGPLGPLDINGYIKFFDKDATYGNGVKGALEAKLNLGVNKIVINSHIMFGHTSFYYWYVDLSYLASIGTPIVPPVSMFGLGGGVYYNMSKQQDISPDALLKGTTNDLNRYKPASNIIGFKASIVVGVGNGTPFHANGTFSMELTSQLGVKTVDLDVDAAMMAELTSDISKAPVNGHGHIGYDFPNKIFDAGVGLNVKYAGITGNGWMALNINGTNGEWYFKLGDPDKRINVNVLNLATLNAYLMMGSNIDGIPDPPAEILKDFPGYKSSRDNSIVSSGTAPGFAFGAGLQYGPTDLTFLMFYMHLSAGMGFDVNLRQYSIGCDGSSNLPGINGWYANGQFYAWASFNFGLNVDVWFYSGKIDVAKVEAAALFKAGLINPSWFEGYLYGHFDVLGGLITGTMHFHVEVGDKCVPPGNPLGSDLPIISELTPAESEKDISIARNPQAVFNYPVNYDFEVINTTSSGDEVLNKLHIDLTDFTIRRKSDNFVVATMTNNRNLSFTEEMKLATLYANDAFDPQTDYTITVSVKAYKIGSGGKEAVFYKGNPVEETKIISFKTGDCLHRLDENAQTLLGSYPFKNQRYLLQKEQTSGFIQLDKNYPCLLNDPNYELLAQFITYESPSQSTPQEVAVGQDGDKITFQIPTLPNEKITELRIIKRRKVNKNLMFQKSGIGYQSTNIYASGSSETSNIIALKNSTIKGSSESNVSKDLELYSYYFKTSKYNTLTEKLNASDHAANAKKDGFGILEGYAADFNFEEGFDVYDVNQTTFVAFGQKFVIYPLIHISEETPGNSWVQNYVRNYFYANWMKAYTMAGDYREAINPAYIRKAATGLQCLIFEPSLNPISLLPITAEQPLSLKEISLATYKNLYNSVGVMNSINFINK